MKKAEIGIVVVVLILLTCLAGCNEPQKIWGQGETTPEYQEMFGNDNMARLNFEQVNIINRHEAILKEVSRRILLLEGKDPNDPIEAAK